MRWLRIGSLWLLLAALSTAGLWGFLWWSWTPQQRTYLRPAVEAAVGSWVSLDVPVVHLAWAPKVAAVLADPRGRPRWYRLPAPVVFADLARLYPVPLSVLLLRVALISALEAAALQVVLLALARSVARQRTHGIPPGGRL